MGKYADDMFMVKAAIEGDQNAFEQIVGKYRTMVAKVIVGMLGNRADADDVGQETFLRFYRSMHQYKGNAALGTYLTRIAINLSLNELKRRGSRRWLSLEEKHGSYHADDRSYHDKDNTELVEKALTQLDTKYRNVVILRIMQGFSTKETAEILKLPIGTVLSRLARAQVKLKPILQKLKE